MATVNVKKLTTTWMNSPLAKELPPFGSADEALKALRACLTLARGAKQLANEQVSVALSGTILAYIRAKKYLANRPKKK